MRKRKRSWQYVVESTYGYDPCRFYYRTVKEAKERADKERAEGARVIIMDNRWRPLPAEPPC